MLRRSALRCSRQMTAEPVSASATLRSYQSFDGVRIVGDDAGPIDAPTVILLHGGGQTRHSWAGAFDRLLAEGYRVISYDARGHGQSDWSKDGAYSLDDRVQDLMTVLKDVSAPFALVGASLGGATSLHAMSLGLPCQGLVLVDIVPEPEDEGIGNIVAFMESGVGGFDSLEEVADAVAAYNPDRPRPSDPSGLMKNLRHRDDGRLYWHWDPLILDNPNVSRGVLRASAQRLSDTRCAPIMVVRGLRSDVVSNAGIAAFKKLIPELEVCDVAGAGHMVAGDRNDAFNEGVLDFLGRVFPSGVK